MQDNKPVKVEKATSDKLKWKDVMEVVKIPRVWLCGILATCNYSALIFHGYVTGYLSEAFGISNTVVANLSVVRTYFLMMIGSLAAGLLADKLGSRIRFMQYAYFGMAVFASLYVLIPPGRMHCLSSSRTSSSTACAFTASKRSTSPPSMSC